MKISFKKTLLQQTELTACFLPRHASERNSESLLLFLFHGMEFRVVFSSEEWFGTVFQVFASIFVPRNGIPSFFLFHGMVQNGIPQVLLLNLSHGTEFRAFFPLGNGSERNSESFTFCGTAGIPLEQTNCSVYSVFRGTIFCWKLPTLLNA
jgi:hypothetical protein